MKYIVFDIETNGLNPRVDEIIEIAALKIADDNIICEFSKLIKPKLPINNFITNLTGITNEQVQNAENEAIVLQEFIDFTKDCEIFLGHNIDEFDMPFLNKRLEMNGLKKIVKKTIDTLKLARNKISYKSVKNFKLETLADYFGINNENAHRAKQDANISWQLYQKLQNFQEQIELCPSCGHPLRVINGPYGKFIGCTAYPKCRYKRSF